MRWSSKWGIPELERGITIAANTRLRSTLGQYKYRHRRIEIAEFLLEEPEDVILEVLCHEAAHAATAHIYGEHMKPHGAEWQELIRKAGYSPTDKLLLCTLPRVQKKKQAKRALWEHSCEVCHMRRLAKRPVKEWRCSSCKKVGLNGDLVITRLEEGGNR